MNDTIKNLIGVVAIIATVSLAYASYQAVNIYDRSSEPSNFRSFSVNAEGEAVTVPDIAEFSFSVITEGGSDVAALQQQNTEKMNKALDFVKKQGIDKKDIITQQYSIQPRYENQICEFESRRPCPPPEIIGYTVRQSARVKIRDFDKISGLLSGVVENGANSVSQLSFTIDDPTAVEQKAREEAIAKAQIKAEEIADAAGFKLGRLLEINEDFYQPYAQRSLMAEDAAFGKGGGTAPAPTIEPGSQEVTVRVYMRYEIE